MYTLPGLGQAAQNPNSFSTSGRPGLQGLVYYSIVPPAGSDGIRMKVYGGQQN
jgi:hypothetical protein